ncbi:hypothetical protein EON80_14445 [bacterium]|nr:MAG: hypothetical protein EON80_14445 [bacterium]
MPVQKRLTDEQTDALMLEFRAKRVRAADFCAEKGIAVPTFKRWRKEWEEKTEKRERKERLARLPESPWPGCLPKTCPVARRGRRVGTITMMVDLADNLGPHLEQAL